jgi:hypothetical protein
MKVPGFSAEISLYRTRGSYRLSAAQAGQAGPQMVRPQQAMPLMMRAGSNVSCSGTNGDKCYCPTGCKQKTNGTCCCTVDTGCFMTTPEMGDILTF